MQFSERGFVQPLCSPHSADAAHTCASPLNHHPTWRQCCSPHTLVPRPPPPTTTHPLPVADPSLALTLVSSHHPQADGAVYVQPAGLGAVARLANHSCTGGNVAMEAGIFDPQRGLEVARLRASKRVRAGEQLTWHYDASTDCQAEAEAVLCHCAACDARAAKRKRRSHLFTLLPASVPRCGKCTTCLQTTA